ncbi:hypothetical protein RHSIM_Rhsim07G0185500 [Rhododendron simsii]|uniref:Pectinesterase n=1 Tax=Rhododendron simsii TaxID=118357 RepID=A0A834GR97_RHOSS|nr:hypothetical protein RHSIM_Rhsim07G0185500 [Rhododendron simsii]
MSRRYCVGIAVLTLFTIIIVGSVIYVTSCHHPATPAPQPPPKKTQPISGPTSVSVEQACQATTDPYGCGATLSSPRSYPSDPPIYYATTEILKLATRICIRNVKVAQSVIADILKNATNDQKVSKAAKTCMEVLRNAEYRQQSTADALPRGEFKDARAWMSASLVYESMCLNGLNKTGSNLRSVTGVVAYMQTVVNVTGEALSLIRSYDIYGNDTGSWTSPQTERDGVWEHMDGSGDARALESNGGFPSGLTVNATVCRSGSSGGSCDYATVQDAVDAAPSNETERRFVIRIKEGVYNETVRVPLEKKNVVFLGDGMGKTVISGSLNVGQPGMTTYDSATVGWPTGRAMSFISAHRNEFILVQLGPASAYAPYPIFSLAKNFRIFQPQMTLFDGVLGDGFMAKDLTIENTAGPRANQAVAFRSDSDRSIIESCEFIGNQDTLCANTLRQFYNSCRIQGNVDFIFGFSASVFQNCLILISPRGFTSDQNVITAHGRFDAAQSTGFVFLNCTVNGTATYMEKYKKKSSDSTKNFLGRPWKAYSRTVFINCNLGPIISPEGWMPWDRDFGLSTLYYGEYGNSGPGSSLSQRVEWSSRIPASYIEGFSVQNFIQGDKWIPLSSG